MVLKKIELKKALHNGSTDADIDFEAIARKEKEVLVTHTVPLAHVKKFPHLWTDAAKSEVESLSTLKGAIIRIPQAK